MRSRVVAELVALFAPPGCAACRTPLDDPHDPLCRDCRRALPWLNGPRCARCALPRPCHPCPAARAAFHRAWSPLAHAGPARDLVAALKFGGALALADVMAAQLAATMPADVAGEGSGPGNAGGEAGRSRAGEGFGPGNAGDGSGTGQSGVAARPVIVPVPAHPASVRHRGFDHASVLARALSRRTGLPLDACLSRNGAAERQIGASRRRRMRPGRLDFAATGPVPAEPLLLDDVHTTGATLDAAARALRAAGARHVKAVTYARTLRH
ncbi:MAG TPA: double zinc ribbon domain-containing protein [Solirubrobacteraceae bacterium]|nr:double zinc ribbon domain-containing protein [Solirubrobacteraceae bacterium]